jgi:hypothetical protein
MPRKPKKPRKQPAERVLIIDESLSNEYARQQFEIFSQQAQELAASVRKMTAATTETLAAGVRKAV